MFCGDMFDASKTLRKRRSSYTSLSMNTGNIEQESLLFDIKELSPYFEIHKIGLNSVRGKILPPVEGNIIALKRYFNKLSFLPYFDKTGFVDSPHVIYLVQPESKQTSVTKTSQYRIVIIPALLFIATVFTTLLVGSLNQGGNPFTRFADLFLGVPFSFSLLLILGGHELGHYFTSQKYGVSVTLPYFLPIPHPLIGTMGAFIRIKSVIPNRQALIRIGVTGPLVGFILAIPITVIGISLSKVTTLITTGATINLGSSLLFKIISNLIHPHIPAGCDLVLHPMAFAGWLGFLVTALNLLPLGQLDGGHIAYAVLGKYRKIATITIIIIMALLGLLWTGWFFWILLIVLFGLRHPKAQDEITKLTTSDKAWALVALIIMILAFIPNPFPIKF